ncbi:hypothetical protein Scep_021482 [Stephania cephalantha]|uniref:Trichome birefringence-like N-terminal domain-containing protein n=1 Tax=Stephania cephalantha TaxID=152367 RepID=A0AAP0HWW3_9MAGN
MYHKNMIKPERHGLIALWFLSLTIIFICSILYSTTPFVKDSKQQEILIETEKDNKCDLFKGHWIRETEVRSGYTNSSCSTIPDSNNCGKHGRVDVDFMNWRWKPDGCELPRFDAKGFLRILRGKTMAFIGDSVARNHMESLLCMLSQEEVPADMYRDSENRFRTWYFSSHDFTLMTLWTKFLVKGEIRVSNSSNNEAYNLYLDEVDYKWIEKLPSVDYAIISAGHWFFRPIYLYRRPSNLIGCVYCNEPNVSSVSPGFALQMAIRSSLKYINGCKTCKKLYTMVRTFSPSHFEGGAWDSGGRCNRTSPMKEGDINLRSTEWEFRNLQVREVERTKKKVQKRGTVKFAILDVTKAMLMRPDGHPDLHWGNRWMRGYSDCVHWCLPGPIDVWNDFLVELLRREKGSSLTD